MLKARRKKRLAEIEYARSNLHVHKMVSDEAKAIYQSKILEAKAIYESRLARGILQNPKMFFNYLKSFSKPSSSIQRLNVDRRTITVPESIAKNLNAHFLSVMTRETTPTPHSSVKLPGQRQESPIYIFLSWI